MCDGAVATFFFMLSEAPLGAAVFLDALADAVSTGVADAVFLGDASGAALVVLLAPSPSDTASATLDSFVWSWRPRSPWTPPIR